MTSRTAITIRYKLVITVFGNLDVPSLEQLENFDPCLSDEVISQCSRVIMNEVLLSLVCSHRQNSGDRPGIFGFGFFLLSVQDKYR